MILGCFEWFLMILGPSNLFWINISKLCANFQEFLEVKDSLANSNGRLERRMEVHKTSIKMVIFCRNPMVGWWGLYIGLFEGLCLTAGCRQRNGRKAVNQHEVAIHLRTFRRLWDCKQKPRFFHFALGSMLGEVGPGWACLRPILGPCCAYVGPMLAYVGPM